MINYLQSLLPLAMNFNRNSRAEIIEAEKQKKDIRSVVLPSRNSNSLNEPGNNRSSSPKRNVPESPKR